MIAIITHPKYFDKSKLYRKKVDLVYIFNSYELYKELSKKYKCVNLNNSYKIVNENFFPSQVYTNHRTISKIYYFRELILQYFYKKKYQLYRSHKIAQINYYYKQDPIYNLVKARAKKTFKTDKTKAMNILNEGIYKAIKDSIEEIVDKKYYELNKDYFQLIFNLIDSFYRAYIYTEEDFKRGAEITTDIFKYNLAMTIIIYYRMEQRDIYKNRFHYNYLRVISRLFIENIHANNIKAYTKAQITHWEEDEWSILLLMI